MKRTAKEVFDDSVSELIRHKARKLIGQYSFIRSDLADIEQDLTLHLIERAEQIDLTNVHKTVLSRILDRKIVSMLRHRFALVRDKKRETSLETMLEQSTCDEYAISDERCAKSDTESDLETDVRDALESLDGEASGVCELLKHYSIAETARRLGLTRGKTRAHMAKMRALLTSAGLDLYSRD